MVTNRPILQVSLALNVVLLFLVGASLYLTYRAYQANETIELYRENRALHSEFEQLLIRYGQINERLHASCRATLTQLLDQIRSINPAIPPPLTHKMGIGGFDDTDWP